MPDGTVTVPLTQGKEAIIDACFAADVLAYKWCAVRMSNTMYAHRFMRVAEQGAKKTRRSISMHRYVYTLAYGVISPGRYIDHINGNGLDNRLENLRLVTSHVNNSNQARHRAGSLPGAHIRPNGKWQAQMTVNGKRKTLGTFNTELEAHNAYLEAWARLT